MSEELFREVTGPRRVGDQRASALRFGDSTVLALLSVLASLRLLPGDFAVVICGSTSLRFWDKISVNGPQGRLTYQLRRLRCTG